MRKLVNNYLGFWRWRYNPPAVEISYHLTVDDYRQGYKAFRRRTTFSRLAYYFAYACFFLIVASALLLSFAGRDKSFRNLFPLWAAAAFCGYVLWYCPYRVASKMIKGSPSAALPHTVDVSDSGLYVRTSASEARLSWDLIIGWAEVERVFALFPSPIMFLPVPKRAMTGEQQDEFRALLRNKVRRRS